MEHTRLSSLFASLLEKARSLPAKAYRQFKIFVENELRGPVQSFPSSTSTTYPTTSTPAWHYSTTQHSLQTSEASSAAPDVVTYASVGEERECDEDFREHHCSNGGICYQFVDRFSQVTLGCRCPIGFRGSVCQYRDTSSDYYHQSGLSSLVYRDIGIACLLMVILFIICCLAFGVYRNYAKKRLARSTDSTSTTEASESARTTPVSFLPSPSPRLSALSEKLKHVDLVSLWHDSKCKKNQVGCLTPVPDCHQSCVAKDVTLRCRNRSPDLEKDVTSLASKDFVTVDLQSPKTGKTLSPRHLNRFTFDVSNYSSLYSNTDE